MYELDRPQACSIARAMEVLGERWTFLILRECFYGVRRFSDMQRNLGIARNILSARLQTLVRAGILERRRYQERPERFEYVITDKGRGLAPALMMLLKWGDEHYAPDGPPVLTLHEGCGGKVDRRLRCRRCRERVDFDEVELAVGPALKAAGVDPFPGASASVKPRGRVGVV